MEKKIYLTLVLALMAGAIAPQSACAQEYLTDGSSTQGNIYYGETAGQAAYKAQSGVMTPLAISSTVNNDTAGLKDNPQSFGGFFTWLLSII